MMVGLTVIHYKYHSTKRVQTSPRPKSDMGFNPNFQINTDPVTDVCWIAPKIYRIHSLVSVYWIHSLVGMGHFAKYHRNRLVTV